MSHTFRPQREPLVAPGAIEHHTTDLTFTASADVTLASLQQKLSEHDQWLPIDGDPSLTLGSLVETNSTGPLRLGFGAWRDLLLGAQFLTSTAALITAGGRTMKNVAGYDLTKFIVGSHGVFGRAVTITARTWKRPDHALLARFQPARDLVGQLLPTTARPSWTMISGGSLYAGYFGDDKALAFYEADLARRHRFRVSVPPVQTLDCITAAHLNDYAADPAFGIVVGSCSNTECGMLCKVVQGLGGQIFFDEPRDINSFYNAQGAELELLERLKSAFSA
jgi:FAD/FMN-containing dehydrogenase